MAASVCPGGLSHGGLGLVDLGLGCFGLEWP